ncbi:DUF6054 family protein [Bacillus mesophilum]|uniref:Uncharacterized protein n=1 Tax=Bacillus mesophilum TaxID=1071718 RepID=A0A7V7RKL8_9BACI|nr:DUF6054 family protein [Bacillus mesophilum]KAB2331880.1 hypothetical protein F7732_14535 [Bacillus mesophilum]
MKKYSEFKLKITPFDAAVLLTEIEELKDLLVFQDYKLTEGQDKQISILIFEKFYFRTTSFASLTVVFDNFEGETVMKCISAGNGDGLFNFGLGSGKNFIKSIRSPLEDYIVEVVHED